MLDLNRKMCVILTNGAQYQFTIRELFSLFTRKEFLSLAFSMVCLMAILDFHSLAPIISANGKQMNWDRGIVGRRLTRAQKQSENQMIRISAKPYVNQMRISRTLGSTPKIYTN